MGGGGKRQSKFPPQSVINLTHNKGHIHSRPLNLFFSFPENDDDCTHILDEVTDDGIVEVFNVGPLDALQHTTHRVRETERSSVGICHTWGQMGRGGGVLRQPNYFHCQTKKIPFILTEITPYSLLSILGEEEV